MSISAFRTTVSCRQRQPITVDGKWFLAEDISSSEGVREVYIVLRDEKKPDSWMWLKTVYLAQGQRHELFPDVFLTATDLSKKSKVKLLIEAPEGVPIWRGYPRHKKVS